MNYKAKKTAGAASALALSALMAASAFGTVTASAATTVTPIDGSSFGTNIKDDQGDTQVWVNGGFHKASDCYYVNGKYYLKGTVGNSSVYKEYTDGTVYINGYTYKMSDCIYANGRYYAPSSATPISGSGSYTYGYYYNNVNYTFYNGYYYLKSQCSYDAKTGTYTPLAGATKYYDYYNGYYPYYYNGTYSYEEFDTYILFNGIRFNKSDCTFYNGKYYPKGYDYSGYYYNGKYYTSYAAYLNALYNYNGIIYGSASSSSSVSKTDPFIYGNEKKKGWSAVINAILYAKNNADIKIDMNETYSLTKKFMSAAASKNVNITLVMPNGATWEFNGKDIDKDYASNVNLAVKYNTNKIPDILKTKASKGASSYSEITIGKDSAYLGFEGTVSMKFNKSNAFADAKLYRYDSSRNVLVLVDETTIGSDGTASFDVVNSGTYAIVITK